MNRYSLHTSTNYSLHHHQHSRDIPPSHVVLELEQILDIIDFIARVVELKNLTNMVSKCISLEGACVAWEMILFLGSFSSYFIIGDTSEDNIYFWIYCHLLVLLMNLFWCSGQSNRSPTRRGFGSFRTFVLSYQEYRRIQFLDRYDVWFTAANSENFIDICCYCLLMTLNYIFTTKLRIFEMKMS